MKKIVLTFGLIAGIVMSAMMAVNFLLLERIGFDGGMVVGYTSMVVAFLLVYFGVRQYRDTIAGGTISFWRAAKVGALIALLASACYVATWQVIYFGGYAGDFWAGYQEHALAKARAGGASDAELVARRAEMEEFVQLYDNPAVNVAYTFLEPLPVALLFVFGSAWALSRSRPSRSQASSPPLARHPHQTAG